MAMQERQPQTASFSSSLLDAIYHSFEESGEGQEPRDYGHQSRNEVDIASLRRAIMVENWMEGLGTKRIRLHSASSSDSSILSDTESSRSSRKAKVLKARAEKKEPISPCGKIAHFLNSIFSPRNLGKNRGMDAWGQIRKSRSMKDTPTATKTKTTITPASRSCLSKNPSAGGSKSKRSVRFLPVDKSIHDNDECSAIGSQFIKKNIDDLRLYERQNTWGHDCFRSEHEEDNMSCSSSDLFELENIGHIGTGRYQQELPVYGTTCVKVNQTIA